MNKVFTTGDVGYLGTEYRLYENGHHVKTLYDTSGNIYRNLLDDGYVHGYTTEQLHKAREEFFYLQDMLEDMENHPIVKDDEEFI